MDMQTSFGALGLIMSLLNSFVQRTAIILERGATFGETSGEQRIILIRVDRRATVG